MPPTEEDIAKLINIKNNNNTLYSIRSVGNDRYRVNVYQKYYVEGCVVPISKIIASKFICNQNGLRDITI